ncbi:peptide-methionine (R)-S-oxide reductase MsrB [Carnobacterium sp. TMP28]|uniref:peptide-methionine (R)-S-oxide reductase MsrB n=1 Tax=Carnobacterium sp. TMP28 TaxID=3397060 RepID=UPI0039DFCCF3
MTKKNIFVLIGLLFIGGLIYVNVNSDSKQSESEDIPTQIDYEEENLEIIYLAGGCFWGVDEYFGRIYGVIDVVSGYANGTTDNPSYEEVVYANTGHAETVSVTYDSSKIDLTDILLYYFKVIDPTSLNQQGNDRGTQYRTGIYYEDESKVETIEKVINVEQKRYDKKIVVEVLPLEHFFVAEEYHQDYLKKNPRGYCTINLQEAKTGVERDDTLGESEVYSKPSDEELKEILSPEAYSVTQNNTTDTPYTHPYDQLDQKGIYVDIVSGEALFSSEDKYDAATGWPTFIKPIKEDALKEFEDTTLGKKRIEVRSRLADSHLGHVFDDGPQETGGLRYCINGSALKFIDYENMEEEGYEEYLEIVE